MNARGRAICGLGFALIWVSCGGRALRNDGEAGTAGTGATAGTIVLSQPPEDDCIVALRIDRCCDEPITLRRAELDSDPCVVAWPRRHALDVEVRSMCRARAGGCETVKCTTPPVPSRIAAEQADGSCVFADECGGQRGLCGLARDASQFCGCEEAHSVAEIEADGCLYSSIDHTIEDCPIPLCGAADPCPTCPNCESSVPARCDLGSTGLNVCGPPFDGFRAF